ncbi:MAG: ABC transporter ATP-binding protein [Candidatus Rokubacteria bacterium]|nr:ABC transporter ATP-binding protein [Candidatus Rokubacteria bacterium]
MAPLLEVRGLTKRFGGVLANDDVSFTVTAGELVGIIGPNGAGKSTLFELITGFVRPDAGSVCLDGRPLAGLSPHAINRAGLARTFQKMRLFLGMTALENAMVGAVERAGGLDAARAQARACLGFVGLGDREDVPARALSTGQRKRLELARALATRPRLLLADEVTGGVDQRTIPTLTALVRRLRGEGVTVVLIEHNMRVVMDLCDRIVALHLGRVIADGPPAAVTRDPAVVRAYLGDAAARA